MIMMSDLAAGEQDRVYIIGEDPESDLPITTEWHKIGRANPKSGQNKGVDDWYERIRALQQGNPRLLKVKKQYNLSMPAKRFEKAVHDEMKRLGIKSRRDATDGVGHGEWYNVNEELGIEICDRVYEKEFRLMNTFFVGQLGVEYSND